MADEASAAVQFFQITLPLHLPHICPMHGGINSVSVNNLSRDVVIVSILDTQYITTSLNDGIPMLARQPNMYFTNWVETK